MLTPELRHRHGNLALAARMMFKFHGPVKTEGAVAVACSDLLAPRSIRTNLKPEEKQKSSNP